MTRFSTTVEAEAKAICDYHLRLFAAVREHFRDGLTQADTTEAERRAADFRTAVTLALTTRPELDEHGFPAINERGEILSPNCSFSKLFRDVARLKEAEKRLMALGVIQIDKAIDETRYSSYRQRAEWGTLRESLRQAGFDDHVRSETLPMRILRDAVANGELDAVGVLLRPIRAYLVDPRGQDREHARNARTYAGGGLLTLEAVVLCRRFADDALVLARVLDEPINARLVDYSNTDDVARAAWRCLQLIEQHVPGVRKIAAIDAPLPLGPSTARVRDRSKVSDTPHADRWTVDEGTLTPASDVLVRNANGWQLVRVDGDDVLERWTVLTRRRETLIEIGQPLNLDARRHIAGLSASLPERSLRVFPTQIEAEEHVQVSQVLDKGGREPEVWIVNVPTGCAFDDSASVPPRSNANLMLSVALLERVLASDRRYAPRACGHRSMFPASNDRRQVSQVLHILLGWALARELDAESQAQAPKNPPRAGAIVPVRCVPKPWVWEHCFRDDCVPDVGAILVQALGLTNPPRRFWPLLFLAGSEHWLTPI